MQSRPWHMITRSMKIFFDDLNPPSVYPVRACGDMPRVTDQCLGGKLPGGGNATKFCGAFLNKPGPADGGYGSDGDPPPPPPRESPRTGLPARQKGVYMPTAHEGAPRRGFGP